jgi:hypothetical protein
VSSRRRQRQLSTTTALDSNLPQRKLLFVFTYLATLTALLILHLALDSMSLSLALAGATSAGFVYAYLITSRYRALTTYIVSLLAAGIFLYYIMLIRDDYVRYGNYLGMLLGILTALLAYKAFSPRDHRFILMVCVIYLLFSSVASYDLKFMLLLPLFLIFAGIALFIANQIEVAVRVASTTGTALRVHFGVGWEFLWMLLRGILGVIVLSVVVYIFTPHSTQENQGLVLNTAPQVDPQDQQPGDLTEPITDDSEVEIGIGSDFDLTDTRKLSADPRPVLQVKSHRGGYLRAQVFDVYTGSGWIKSASLENPDVESIVSTERTNQPTGAAFKVFNVPLFDFPDEDYASELEEKHQITFPKDVDNIYSTNKPESLKFDINRQEIKLLEDQPSFYFSMYQPFRLENISVTRSGALLDMPLVDDAATIRPEALNTMHPKGFSYTVYSLEPRVKSALLADVPSIGPVQIVSRYTQLPLDPEHSEQIHGAVLGIKQEDYRPISQRLINYAGQFAHAPASSTGENGLLFAYEKVEAIRQHLLDPDQGYTYARQFKPLEGTQEITEAFCLGTREGYCRQFASTMAVLCRLNGIPARVVSGYSPGTYSFIKNAYIYKASNAHTWVEVYFDGYGWISFDPTPASTAGPESGDVTQWLAGIVDFLQDLFIIDPAGTQQTIIALLAQAWQLALENGPISISALALVVLIVAAWWFWRRRPVLRRGTRLQPENSVVEAFLAARTELRRLGLQPTPGHTGSGFLADAAASLPDLADSLGRLSRAYQRAAFSNYPLSEDTLTGAWEPVTEVRNYVRLELARRKQQK